MARYFVVERNSAYCPKCDKPATHQVIGPRNSNYGYFCKKHAEAHVKYLSKEE